MEKNREKKENHEENEGRKRNRKERDWKDFHFTFKILILKKRSEN